MGFVDGETPYDRDLLLEQAARARAKRQWRRAIAFYRRILAVERTSVEIHQKLAPLLAETGQEFDAWNSYRAVAQSALREGRDDRALAAYREATRALTREIQAWQGLARMLVRQDEAEAVEALIEGSRQFRSHWNRPQAIHLLRRARTIAPWHFETVLELARHLARANQRAEARLLLEGLAERAGPRRLRRVRAAQLAASPGPRGLWRWFLAWLGRPAAREAAAARSGAGVVPLRALDPLADAPARRQGVSSTGAAGSASPVSPPASSAVSSAV